jgi:hypothetical protein
MATTEACALRNYRAARAAYDATPNEVTARGVLALATALCDISDDYAELLDEADDIMAEPA